MSQNEILKDSVSDWPVNMPSRCQEGPGAGGENWGRAERCQRPIETPVRDLVARQKHEVEED